MSISNKAVMTFAALSVVAAPAFAQLKTAGNLEIYGRAHLSLDSLDDGAQYNRMNLSSNSSRLGLRGSKSFGDLTGIWQIEQEIFFNLNGANNDAINRFATRDTFAGLQGSFGQLRVGKFDTPFKVARDPANLFGDQLGDLRNITRVGAARFDERPNNIIEYQTPKMGGAFLKFAYAPHEGSSATVTNGVDKKDALTSVAFHFAQDAFDSAIAYESYEKDATNGKRNATRVALGYKLAQDVKVVGFYQDASHTPTVATAASDGGTVTGLGVEYQVAPAITVRAHAFSRDADKANGNADLYAIGLERKIDNALRFYVNYGQMNNGAASNLAPWVQARSTAQPGSNGRDAKGISLGMRYDF